MKIYGRRGLVQSLGCNSSPNWATFLITGIGSGNEIKIVGKSTLRNPLSLSLRVKNCFLANCMGIFRTFANPSQKMHQKAK
jgi:hypothetical protein